MRREAYRLDAAMERTKTNPLGIGISVRTFPEVVVMGLKSGNTSSLTAFLNTLNATGWNRKSSCPTRQLVSGVRGWDRRTLINAFR